MACCNIGSLQVELQYCNKNSAVLLTVIFSGYGYSSSGCGSSCGKLIEISSPFFSSHFCDRITHNVVSQVTLITLSDIMTQAVGIFDDMYNFLSVRYSSSKCAIHKQEICMWQSILQSLPIKALRRRILL
uniref:CUB domain-containing protein n=1 Tax=Ascaris lumbricoides TaxID=6252 RepID=A0A0M3IL17_ASCLU